MIRIEITDPQTLDGAVLLSTARYLMQLAGHDVVLPTQADPVFAAPKVEDCEPGEERTERERALELEEVKEMAKKAQLLAAGNSAGGTGLPSMPPAEMVAKATLKALDFNPFAKPVELGPEFDASGTKWDGRIHSRTRSKTADGNWKLMRGLDKKKIETVTEEVPPANFNKEELAEPTPIDNYVAVPPPPVVPVPPAPSALDVPLDRTAVDNPTFAEIIARITQGTSSGRVTKMQVYEVLDDLGIGSAVDIMNHPEHFAEVDRRLTELLK